MEDLLTATDFHKAQAGDVFEYADGEKGVAKETGERGRRIPATLFPSPQSAGCSFNVDLLCELGRAVGEECLSDGIDALFAADANVSDNRTSCYSSEPFLAGKAAGAYIKGVQSVGVAAVLRNFLRPAEKGYVDERKIKERYAKSYEVAIKTGEPKAVSVARERVNGVPLSESPLIEDILRKAFAYNGAVIAEPYAVNDKVKSLIAGVDFESVPNLDAASDLKEGLDKGVIDEDMIRRSAERVKELFSRKNKIRPSDMKKNQELSYIAAKESVVLLKNDGVLPLDENLKTAIFGEEKTQEGELVNPFFEEKFFQAFYEKKKSIVLSNKKKSTFSADVALIWINSNEAIEVAKTFKRSGKKTIGLLNKAEDSVYLRDKYFDALLFTGLYGGSGGKALTDIILGDSPSGKLSIELRDKRSSLLYPFGYGASYAEFVFSNVKLSQNLYREGDEARISVEVKNVGDVAGKEVVQVYVAPPKSHVEKPAAKLIGFAKVDLDVGEKKRVTFTIKDEDLSYYDVDLNRWNIETGNYKIKIGSSSTDIKASKTLQVFSKDNLVGKNAVVKEKIEDNIDALTTFGELKRKNRKAYSFAMKKACVYLGKDVEELPIGVLRSYEKNIVARILELANK